MITQNSTIVSDYVNGASITKVARTYGVTTWCVNKAITEAGILKRPCHSYSRKHTVDETYFDKIDNAQKAYFLGLLYADGCNYERSSSIQIQLQKRDCATLESLNVCIRNQRPIRYFTRTLKSGKIGEYGMFRVHSKHLSHKLVELGCFYKKSQTLTTPPIGILPENLKKAFILGFFDGDGSITYYKKLDQYSMMFICNDLFKEYIEQLLRDELGLHVTSLLRKKQEDSMPLWQITIGSIPGMVKLINWMCSTDTDNLQITRKKERMLAVLKKMETYITPIERGRLNIQKINAEKYKDKASIANTVV
jgi:hypothetical protein